MTTARAWWQAEVGHEWTAAALLLVAVVSTVMAAYLFIAARRRVRGPSGARVPRAFLLAHGAYLLVTVATIYAVLAVSVFYGDEDTALWGFVLTLAATGSAVWLFREWVRVTRGTREGGE